MATQCNMISVVRARTVDGNIDVGAVESLAHHDYSLVVNNSTDTPVAGKTDLRQAITWKRISSSSLTKQLNCREMLERTQLSANMIIFHIEFEFLNPACIKDVIISLPLSVSQIVLTSFIRELEISYPTTQDICEGGYN